jgi:peptide/nickel transport system permease protein
MKITHRFPALIALVIVVLIFTASFTVSFIAYFFRVEIEAHQLERNLHFGYDAFGRNCLALTLLALSRSILALIPVGALSLLTSIGIALLALINQERVRFFLRTTLDTLSALPGFLIALALGVIFPGSQATFYLGAMLLITPSLIRYFESQLLKMQNEPYIHASKALGATHPHLLSKHYLPALSKSVITILPFILTRLILIETSLSFLGLSATPEHETWGRLLGQGKDYLIEAPWILATAALPLCLLLGSFHLLSHKENQ